MLVKDIIVLACDFTENEELGKAIEENESLSDKESKEVEKFVKCFNLVSNEVASEFVPIKKVEQFEVDNGKILFSNFSAAPYKILYVKNSLGRKVRFKVFEDHIFALCKKAIVAYSTLPSPLSLDGSFDSFLPERIYAYGVAREYLFMQGKFDDADIFEERFKNSLEYICRQTPHARLPRRRWI